VVDQKQTATGTGFHTLRQAGTTAIRGKARPLILHLPDQPAGRADPPDSKALGGITTIAVPDRIDQGLMESQLQLSEGRSGSDRFEQQIHQGRQLQGGGGYEINPAQGHPAGGTVLD
jgi:hypothetical protein